MTVSYYACLPTTVRLTVVTELSEVRVEAAARTIEWLPTLPERMGVFVAVQTMAPVFSEGSSASGVRRTLHRGGSSVWIDEHTANTSAKWCSPRGHQLEEVSVQGSVQPGIDFETFINRGYISRHSRTGLLRDPVRHAGDWEGVRPWPRPLPVGRGLDGANDRAPDKESGKEKWFAPFV